MAYIETPRTDAGNATFMSNGQNLENFSVENSFLSPLKRKDDIITQMRNGRGPSLKTPRARVPFADRRNLPTIPARGEFTPLLQSVAKKNLERNGKVSGAPETPAFLKAGYQGGDSPVLPGAEASALYESAMGSSVLGDNDGTPIPQVASSSAQSTPLAILPKRDAAGVLTDQGNLMTLREQENIINKIEKENFGLKLKIHFLEESLRKAGPGFNEAAMKENTDLKVDRITMQKDLARCKKTLGQAERDIEAYRRHVEEMQEKAMKKHADEGLRQELEELRRDVTKKDAHIQDLQEKLDNVEGRNEDLDKLKGDIDDLEADVREKERLIDERDDEIDRVKSQAKKDSDELDEVYAELEAERKRTEDLEEKQGSSAESASKLTQAQHDLQEALEAKCRAEDDLDELRDEMSNKSINTKGLSRQLEDKANKLQDDLSELRDKHSQLQERFDDKMREAKRLQEIIHDLEQDADVRDQRLKDQNELLRNEHESTLRKCESLTIQMQQQVRDLQSKSEEKDLLHSRHDALTAESQTLQKDLTRASNRALELEGSLREERQHAEDNDRQLRLEARDEVNRLSEEVDNLRRELEDKESQFAADQDHWESQRRNLQSQKEKAEEQANGLQRTINKIQETEGTLSGQELKLRQALESEKQRHLSEEAILQRQVRDLGTDIEQKRQALDDLRSDLSQAKEDLRVNQRELGTFEEKVQALEDEVDVLQTSLDEEAEKARENVIAAELDAENLRSQLSAAKEQLESGRADLHDEGQDSHLEEMTSRLRAAEEELRRVRIEKQSVQDKLATSKIEMHKLQGAVIDAEQKVLRLEARVADRESSSQRGLHHDERAAELSIVQKDLAAARKNEKDYLQREQSHKDSLRDLKEQIGRLERQTHEAEIARLVVDSPKSSVGGSARKDELIELQRQLTDAHQQLQDARTKSKEDLNSLRRRLANSEQQTQVNIDRYEQQQEQLEADLSATRHDHENLLAKNATANQTINRLRTRISSLEQDLRNQRQTATSDTTIAEERKDLHEMLKDAKLEAEDLQVQITSRETSLAAASAREKELRAQLKRVREERTMQTQKSSALSVELDGLQSRYERAVDNLSHQQRSWEEERKAMVSRVRFANTSMSSLHGNEKLELVMKENEKRHFGELKGLAKQIQWLRAKFHREEDFRMGLIYEKKYLTMQIEMFEACNSIDLQLLSEMGITSNSPKASARLRLGDALRGKQGKLQIQRKASLRVVGLAVIAGCRMRRMAGDWAGQKKVREALRKKLEGMGEGKGKRMSTR